MAAEIKEGTVRSKDGTTIAYRTVGGGPAVIVIPGALARAIDFDGFARALAAQCAVYVIERRGRGNSGPQGQDYSIDKEVEDVLALQRMTGASLLFGHSFGGLVAFETSIKSDVFKKVAVYEAGVSIHGSINGDWAIQCTQELAREKSFDAFVTFVRGINPETSGRAPRWLLKFLLPIFIGKKELSRKCELLTEAVREHAESARLNDTYKKYAEISAPVLLMSGKDVKRTGAGRVAIQLGPVLQNSEVELFPKLDHFGPEQDPTAVGKRVLEFFFGPEFEETLV